MAEYKVCPQCGNPRMIPKDREYHCDYCNYKVCEECNDSFREIQDNPIDNRPMIEATK